MATTMIMVVMLLLLQLLLLLLMMMTTMMMMTRTMVMRFVSFMRMSILAYAIHQDALLTVLIP